MVSLIKDKDVLLEQIKRENKLGFTGYFKKNMEYYKGLYVNEKRALQLITPKQTLFALVRSEYRSVCNTLLEIINNKKPSKPKDGTKRIEEDIYNCMKMGIIYIREEDNDLSPEDKKHILGRINCRRKCIINIPKYVSGYQSDELNKTLKILDFSSERFNPLLDSLEVHHYIDENNIQITKGIKALEYIVKELEQAYIKDDVILNPDEQVIAEKPYRNEKLFAQEPKAPFVEHIETKPITSVGKKNSNRDRTGTAHSRHGE